MSKTTSIRKVGVLTCGEDAPGMNACIRAVVRTALSHGLEVGGIMRGYQGLVEGEIEPLDARSVGGIIDTGGTILQTVNDGAIANLSEQRKALRKLRGYDIDASVVIGSLSAMEGALALHQLDYPIVGVPATITNDICYTDIAIGADSAINTILDAIDRVKDTASSHRRAFLIEVMGSYLALVGGITGGAELILIPEVPQTLEDVVQHLKSASARGKTNSIILVTPEYEPNIDLVAEYLKERESELGYEVRVTKLGFIQRGGRPSGFERLLATRLGVAAVENLLNGNHGVMVGLTSTDIATTSLEEVVSCRKKVNMEYWRIAELLEK